MKHAILTGFEPFGPYKYNPTQDIAREYNGRIIEDVKIFGLVLPCTYYGASKLLSDKINELSPNIILGTGLASRVNGIRIETVGRNIMNGKYEDAEGRKPDKEPIIKDGDPWHPTTFNNSLFMMPLCKAGIPAELSIDAEGFICNSLIYLTAKRIYDEKLPIKFAFFHTPWTTDYVDKINLEPGKITIEKADLRKTIEILIKEMGV